MKPNLATPRDVSEFLLARTKRAIMSRDAALFASCFALPQHFETFEGRIFCESTSHLNAIFFSVVDHMRKSGMTDMVRHCVAAEFRDPDTIEATHEGRLLSGNRVMQPAYPVFSIIKKFDDRWKITYSMYAITDAPGHSRAMISVPPPDMEPVAVTG
jgi:hypothetical protein